MRLISLLISFVPSNVTGWRCSASVMMRLPLLAKVAISESRPGAPLASM